MAQFQLSLRAEADLLKIGDYTLRTWGTRQADRYLDELQICCHRLGTDELIGRPCYQIRPGLHRMEQGEHVIFYRRLRTGILVSRILHSRMLPQRHPMED